MHGAIRRYGQWEPGEGKNLFAGKGRVQLAVYVGALPPETRIATRHEWQLLDEVEQHIQELEKRIRLGLGQLGYVRLLRSLPGVGEILSAAIYLEIGEVRRFGCAALSSYAGLTPSVHASGGKIRMGPTSAMANHHLKWAFVEAANCIVMQKHRFAGRHERCERPRTTARLPAPWPGTWPNPVGGCCRKNNRIESRRRLRGLRPRTGQRGESF